jgi:hypothetical protein
VRTTAAGLIPVLVVKLFRLSRHATAAGANSAVGTPLISSECAQAFHL